MFPEIVVAQRAIVLTSEKARDLMKTSTDHLKIQKHAVNRVDRYGVSSLLLLHTLTHTQTILLYELILYIS